MKHDSRVEASKCKISEREKNQCEWNAATQFHNRVRKIVRLRMMSKVCVVLKSRHPRKPRSNMHEPMQRPFHDRPRQKSSRKKSSRFESDTPLDHAPRQHNRQRGREDEKRSRTQYLVAKCHDCVFIVPDRCPVNLLKNIVYRHSKKCAFRPLFQSRDREGAVSDIPHNQVWPRNRLFVWHRVSTNSVRRMVVCGVGGDGSSGGWAIGVVRWNLMG